MKSREGGDAAAHPRRRSGSAGGTARSTTDWTPGGHADHDRDRQDEDRRCSQQGHRQAPRIMSTTTLLPRCRRAPSVFAVSADATMPMPEVDVSVPRPADPAPITSREARRAGECRSTRAGSPWRRKPRGHRLPAHTAATAPPRPCRAASCRPRLEAARCGAARGRPSPRRRRRRPKPGTRGPRLRRRRGARRGATDDPAGRVLQDHQADRAAHQPRRDDPGDEHERGDVPERVGDPHHERHDGCRLRARSSRRARRTRARPRR